MKIKDIDETELVELLKLYSHLHEKDELLPSQAELKEIWRNINANNAIKYFGVYVKDVLVSSCTIIIIPNLTRGCRSYGVIENVVTHEGQRNNGYGKSVLGHALEFAWQQNCYKVMLMTGRLNEETFRFYESVGFNRLSKQAFIAKPKHIS